MLPRDKRRASLDNGIMPEPPSSQLEELLRQIAAAAPDPWYPSAYSKATGTPRESLDPPLDDLRVHGLVRFTDWVQGDGQGFAITPAGKQLLENPRDLARLRAGTWKMPAEVVRPVRDPLAGRETEWARGEAARNALISPVSPIFIIELILLNIAWFMVEYGVAYNANGGIDQHAILWGPGPDALQKTGALAGEFLLHGQWWRLFTCCFVHIGLIHLVVNMYSLYAVGWVQESMWGHVRLLIIYLISGIVGSCAMVISGPVALGAGASGAIFGLLGSLMVWILLNRRYIGPMAGRWLRQLVIVLIINVYISTRPGISGAAHFGGGIGGLIAGLLMYEHRFARGFLRWLAALGLVALPILAIAVVWGAEKRDPRWEALDFRFRIVPALDQFESGADRVYNSTLKPLVGHKVDEFSEEEVRHAVAGLHEQREQINQAAELLRRAGPYRLDEVEKTRTNELHRLEGVISASEHTEFEQLVAPRANDADRGARQVYARAAKLLLPFDPATWDNASVQDTVAAFDEVHTRLVVAAELVKGAGPYEGAREATRQQVLEAVEAVDGLIVLAGRRLREGKKWTKEEEQQFAKQQRRVRKLNKAWQQLLRS
jgi:rhomboid protease GluP